MTIALHCANSSGFLKDPSYFRIHLDIEVAFLSSLFMSSLYSYINPIIKRLANQGINDVGYVLTRQLLQLGFHHRQRGEYIVVLPGEIHQVMNGQPFKLRNNDMLDVLRFDHFSIPVHQVLHMPNCHCFKARQVGTDIMGQKAIHFPFSRVLGSECLSRHIRERLAGRVDLLPLLCGSNVI